MEYHFKNFLQIINYSLIIHSVLWLINSEHKLEDELTKTLLSIIIAGIVIHLHLHVSKISNFRYGCYSFLFIGVYLLMEMNDDELLLTTSVAAIIPLFIRVFLVWNYDLGAFQELVFKRELVKFDKYIYIAKLEGVTQSILYLEVSKHGLIFAKRYCN